MVFHELLELLHFLNHHLSMSVLEAVPVWFHHYSPKTGTERGKTQAVQPPQQVSINKRCSRKLNIPLKMFKMQNIIDIRSRVSNTILQINCNFCSGMFFFPTVYYLYADLSIKTPVLKCCRGKQQQQKKSRSFLTRDLTCSFSWRITVC